MCEGPCVLHGAWGPAQALSLAHSRSLGLRVVAH